MGDSVYAEMLLGGIILIIESHNPRRDHTTQDATTQDLTSHEYEQWSMSVQSTHLVLPQQPENHKGNVHERRTAEEL